MSDTPTPEATSAPAPVQTPEATQTAAETPTQTPAPAPPPQPLSTNLKALMVREQATREAEVQLRAVPALQAENTRLKELAQSNPAAFIEQYGGGLANFDSARSELSDPVAGMRRELSELKSSIEMQSRKDSDRSHVAQLGAIEQNVVKWVDESEKFPFVRKLGAQKMVFQHMLQHQQRTGQELSEHDAAKTIEGQLREIVRQGAALLSDTEETMIPAVNEAPTLTNQHSAQRGTPTKRLPTVEEVASLLRYTESD